MIDDEPTVCEAMRMILKGDRHLIKTFTDPREGATYAIENDWDIVLLNLQMPHMHGLAIAELLKRRYPKKPIVTVAARTLIPAQANVDRALLKPFGVQELRQAITDLLP